MSLQPWWYSSLSNTIVGPIFQIFVYSDVSFTLKLERYWPWKTLSIHLKATIAMPFRWSFTMLVARGRQRNLPKMCCAFRVLIFLNKPVNLLKIFSFPSSPWLLTLASSVMTRKTVLDILRLGWKNRRFDGNARQNYFFIESLCARGF